MLIVHIIHQRYLNSFTYHPCVLQIGHVLPMVKNKTIYNFNTFIKIIIHLTVYLVYIYTKHKILLNPLHNKLQKY